MISFDLTDLTSPSSYMNTSSFQIHTSHSGFLIDSITSGLVLNFECHASCLTCTPLATNCTSCNPVSALPFLLSNECLASCPEGYFGDTDKCSVCEDSCKTCSGTADTCTSCESSVILWESACVPTCPSEFQRSGDTCVEKDKEVFYMAFIPCAILLIWIAGMLLVLVFKMFQGNRLLVSWLGVCSFIEIIAWLYFL